LDYKPGAIQNGSSWILFLGENKFFHTKLTKATFIDLRNYRLFRSLVYFILPFTDVRNFSNRK